MSETDTFTASADVTLSDASELDALIGIVETRNTQIAPSPCAVALHQVASGTTRVEGNQVYFRVRGAGAPRKGSVAFAVVQNGSNTRFNSNYIQPGDLLYCGSGADFELLAEQGFEWFGISLPTTKFDEYIRHCLGLDPQPFESQTLTLRAEGVTAPLRQWWKESLAAKEAALPPDNANIQESFLHAFYSNLNAHAPDHGLSYRRRRAIALQAEELLRANVGGQLSVLELCKSLGASRRTVESAFVTTFGVSPARYFQSLKLQHARKLLKSRTAEWGGIKAIAYECGFTKLSEFSSAYRKLFGELPSETFAAAPRVGSALTKL